MPAPCRTWPGHWVLSFTCPGTIYYQWWYLDSHSLRGLTDKKVGKQVRLRWCLYCHVVLVCWLQAELPRGDVWCFARLVKVYDREIKYCTSGLVHDEEWCYYG
jgi:hypothetical protein